MCGIAGIYHFDGSAPDPEILRRMTRAIAHRGPDGEGVRVDGPAGLGHRRLAILDLTSAGRQPMATEDGALALTYNGEVYNFQELRSELEKLGHRFRSRTDTEVILRAYDAWGDACVDRLSGMFAFALWDGRRSRLLLARDRYGIKPLYWSRRGNILLFGSEIKALLKHPALSAAMCPEALDEYFTFQNIFTDRTLFEGVRLLPAGHTLTLEAGREPRLARYWSCPAPGSETRDAAACERELLERFEASVASQLVSDVPIGAYLSGGMDSGSIAAVASRRLKRLTTFTGGFDLSSVSGLELGFDERAAAETLSNLFKTEHYEVVLHAGDMEWVLPELVWHLEDLRVGQSYPNYYVARLASKFVKVVLSGAGGDELFGGYPWRYQRGEGATGRDAYLRHYYDYWQRLVPDVDKKSLFNAETMGRIGGHSTFDVFRSRFDAWPGTLESTEDRVNASLRFEFETFLHGLLVVEDKLSMAHGLETRVPFLDDGLVDFALRLPARFKLRNLERAAPMDENLPAKRALYARQTNDGKAILRSAMARLIPPDTLERAKQGFSAPDATWFRGQSIDYINRLLRDPDARVYRFLQPDYVTAKLDQHCSGQHNNRLVIWSLLCLEWWCRCFLDGQDPEREMESYHASRGPRPDA